MSTARPSILKRTLFGAALASMAVAVWLLTVITFILPRIGNTAQIPFWSVVMIGFFAFGAATWFVLRFPSLPGAIRIGLAFVAGTAILLGLSALFENEVQSRRNGHGEGYITLMAAILTLHGVLLLWHLLRRQPRLPSPTETRDS